MSRGFFRNTAIVGLTTLLSRVTGLVRDIVYATAVPAPLLEVFVLANQTPNLLRRLFAEGAFSQAFVPVVAEYRSRRSTSEVRELVESVAGVFLVSRTADQSFVAVDAVCSHQSCTITGIDGTTYVCPCHGSRYDRNGRVMQGPATASLRQFSTSFASGVLTINL